MDIRFAAGCAITMTGWVVQCSATALLTSSRTFNPPQIQHARPMVGPVYQNFVVRYSPNAVEIHRTARKHRVRDEDVRHAVAHAVYSGEVDDDGEEEGPLRVLYLGPDRAGNLLEVVVIELDDGSQLAIHAMKMQARYRELLPEELRHE